MIKKNSVPNFYYFRDKICYVKMPISKKIEQKIASMPNGSIMFISDFVAEHEYDVAKKVLQRLCKKEKIIRLSRGIYYKPKKDKLFGIINKKYPYSDKERTIIDALDYPKYLGGLNKVINTTKSSKYNKNKLVNYSIKYNSIKIMKLVGYLTNSSKLFNTLKNKNSLSYYTTIKNSGTKLLDKKWMIRLT